MALHKLKDSQVAKAKPRLKANSTHPEDFVSEYVMSDGGGLYLHVRANGSKLWTFMYASPLTSRRDKIGLGKYPDLTSANARKLAASHREQVAMRLCPKAEREAAKTLRAAEAAQRDWTFKRLADEMYQDGLKCWGADHAGLRVLNA